MFALLALVVALITTAFVFESTLGAHASTPPVAQETAAVKEAVAAAEDLEVAYPYPLPSLAHRSGVTLPKEIFRPNGTPHAW